MLCEEFGMLSFPHMLSTPKFEFAQLSGPFLSPQNFLSDTTPCSIGDVAVAQ
jgi:hypothetical protein